MNDAVMHIDGDEDFLYSKAFMPSEKRMYGLSKKYTIKTESKIFEKIAQNYCFLF